MFNVINNELVTFSYDSLENGDTFKYTPPFKYGSVYVYTVFKMGSYMHMTLTSLNSECCEVKSYRIEKHPMYYLDRYGEIQRYYRKSIQDYLIEQKRLPPDTVKTTSLKQLKEELNQGNVTPLVTKLDDVIKEYTKLERVSVLLKDELNKQLIGGDEVLLEFNYGYGHYHQVLVISEDNEEEEKGIFEM